MNEQALKDRLKAIAQLENRSFQEVWKLLILERFLVRLARSDYHDKFIFKGGLLLSYYLFIGRETTDIDFLMREIKIEMPRIQAIFTEIAQVVVDDGFGMSFSGISELEHTHMNYPGCRVVLNINFGKMKDRIQVDIGVGDLVEPKLESLALYQYRGKPIFEGSVSLQVYPIETVFAEKLESLVYRGAANSRMKDFHDLFLLCREKNLLNAEKLKKTINTVFNQRQTKQAIPIVFNNEEYATLQVLWAGHLRGLGNTVQILNLPKQIAELINEVNIWLGTTLPPVEMNYVSNEIL